VAVEGQTALVVLVAVAEALEDLEQHQGLL
jgi:hypothetical protein